MNNDNSFHNQWEKTQEWSIIIISLPKFKITFSFKIIFKLQRILMELFHSSANSMNHARKPSLIFKIISTNNMKQTIKVPLHLKRNWKTLGKIMSKNSSNYFTNVRESTNKIRNWNNLMNFYGANIKNSRQKCLRRLMN